MKTLKSTSKLSATLLVVFMLFMSMSAFAQDAKVIQIDGLNTMKFSKTKITAKPGQKITIKLTTISELPAAAMSHDFVLLKQSANVKAFAMSSSKFKNDGYIDPSMKDQVIAHTAIASGGQTVEVTFTAPKAGKYLYVCTFPGHYLAGMKGVLTVKN